MKRYCIKSRPGKEEYLDILGENDEGYRIKVTRICEGYEKTREDFINHHLFDICLKTGYLSALAECEMRFSAA
ncbi:MAG: hypothetical protein FWG27_08770 [Treponema sp.]|nr:hypothetical protein [Treponema sp.]